MIIFLTGSNIESVCMNAMGVNPEENSNNVSIILKKENGSRVVINYYANGSKAYSKEWVEFFSQERTIIMNNFRKTEAFGVKSFSKMKTTMDKGPKNQFQRFIQTVQQGGEALKPFDNIVNASRDSFAGIESLKENRCVEII